MIRFMPSCFLALSVLFACTSASAAAGPLGPYVDDWPGASASVVVFDASWTPRDIRYDLDLPTGGLHSDAVVDLTPAVQHPTAARPAAEAQTAEQTAARRVVAKTVEF